MSNANAIGSLQQALNSIATTAAKSPEAANASASQTSSGSTVNHADQTSLSHATSILSQALSASDTRSSRIAGLQEAIASGTYNVASSDVADKMIQSLLGE
jgi:negative regulator of flagellin synthesis FlgM